MMYRILLCSWLAGIAGETALAQAGVALGSPEKTSPVTNRVASTNGLAAGSRKTKLTPAEMKRVEAGKANYELVCLPCHQPHGLGQEGLAPPLAGSEWVAGTEQRLIRIVLNGLRGPITVKGQKFELDMPALGILEDEQIATVLTYIRNEWGHSYAPVATETVKAVREKTADRADSWTQEELKNIK